MKRRDLVRHLESHGCQLLREGARHSIYVNPATKRTSSVPRHTEVNDVLARVDGCDDAAGIPGPGIRSKGLITPSRGAP